MPSKRPPQIPSGATDPSPAPRVTSLEALRPDPLNARRRTQRSHALLERSLSEYGAARSIVIDEDGVVLAGNGTLEAAASIGIEKVLVVPADGNTLVAVQRTDLTPREKVEYAISDNRTSDLSEFDGEALEKLLELDPELDLSPFWTDEEIAALGGTDVEVDERPEPPAEALTLTLKFKTEAALQLFQQSLVQLSAALSHLPGSEERLQLVIDQWLAIRADEEAAA